MPVSMTTSVFLPSMNFQTARWVWLSTMPSTDRTESVSSLVRVPAMTPFLLTANCKRKLVSLTPSLTMANTPRGSHSIWSAWASLTSGTAAAISSACS